MKKHEALRKAKQLFFLAAVLVLMWFAFGVRIVAIDA